MLKRFHIFSLEIAHLTFEQSLQLVLERVHAKKSSFICFANVHMVVEAYRDPSFREQLKKADFILADGKPVADACSRIYGIRQERISGMDFLPGILETANENNLSVFVYGSTKEVIEKAEQRIKNEFSGVKLAGSLSPPLITQTELEATNDLEQIRLSGAQLILVSLGCPKQEMWMARHSEKINGVMLGIGGALPVFAGIRKRAPRWMQDRSLEWFFRLLQQPGRLFKRYAFTNSYFIYLVIRYRFRKILNPGYKF